MTCQKERLCQTREYDNGRKRGNGDWRTAASRAPERKGREREEEEDTQLVNFPNHARKMASSGGTYVKEVSVAKRVHCVQKYVLTVILSVCLSMHRGNEKGCKNILMKKRGEESGTEMRTWTMDENALRILCVFQVFVWILWDL
jgi:hypothetical protein